MKVIIIEDELPAAEKLERYILRYDPTIEIITKIQSVAEAISWFKLNLESIDLIFMDIELIDGKSFLIFEAVNINKPVIFTTAYDEYALKAFEVNSIGYLLKPINFPDLSAAIDKYSLLRSNNDTPHETNIGHLLEGIANTKKYKNRFMIKIGEHIRSITTDKIVFFYAEGRNAYITTDQGRRMIIDYKLEELEEMLDPIKFLRVNRTFIVNIDFINDVLVYSNSRLKIITEIAPEKEIIVSREKVNGFKKWFDGEG